MIYVKSHYNRLDKMFFGAKIRYDYKTRIRSYLTKFLKNHKIKLSLDETAYLKNNITSLFTVYRYFDIKVSNIYRLLNQLCIKYLNYDDDLTKSMLMELFTIILNNKKGFTQGKNIE